MNDVVEQSVHSDIGNNRASGVWIPSKIQENSTAEANGDARGTGNIEIDHDADKAIRDELDGPLKEPVVWDCRDQTLAFLSFAGIVVTTNFFIALTQLASRYGWVLFAADLTAVTVIAGTWIEVRQHAKRHVVWSAPVRLCAGLAAVSLLVHLLLGRELAQLAVFVVALVSLRYGNTLAKQVQQWPHFVKDCDRRKQAEQTRRNQGNERQRLAVEASGSGYWYWDLSTDEVQFSPSWATMLGYTSEGVGRSPDDWFDRVHPHYLPELKEALSAHLYGRTDRFQAQYRIQHRDGIYLWVLNRGLAVRNSDGSPIGISGSQIDITQLVDVEKSIVDEAFKDRLTDLANRQAFLIRLERALDHVKRGETGPLAVLFLDLDRFKVINDSLGHLVGDRLLAAVASRLRNCVREARGDLVARFGGDEFVVILEELVSNTEASNVAQRMLEAMVAPFCIGQHEIRTGVSIGIAVSDSQTERAEDLLRNADAAMYHAKSSSRDKVAFFNTSMHARVMRLNQLQNDLAEAIGRGELMLHYQPIVSASTGKIEAAEALVRWRHSSGDLIGPSEFIPIAEETGLIESIGEWVLRTACSDAMKWHDTELHPLRISVNVSPLQLTAESLPSLVHSILSKSGLPPDLLELEFTETALMSNVPMVVRIIEQLAGFGVSVSLDDFGTGYSSLEQLRRFRFHTVKMDRSFVAGLTSDSRAAAVAKGLINLVHQLGAQVTAEGVETETQLSFLKAHDCDRIQGYYASRPLDVEAFTALLKTDFNLYQVLEPANAS